MVVQNIERLFSCSLHSSLPYECRMNIQRHLQLTADILLTVNQPHSIPFRMYILVFLQFTLHLKYGYVAQYMNFFISVDSKLKNSNLYKWLFIKSNETHNLVFFLITHSLQLNVQILLNRNQIEFDNLQCLRDMYVEASIVLLLLLCFFFALNNLIVICCVNIRFFAIRWIKNYISGVNLLFFISIEPLFIVLIC